MQQISLHKWLIPVLSVKVNIGFEICQHRERMHYSLKDFSHFVLDFVKTVYHSYRSESTGFALAAFIDRKEIVKIEMISAMTADNKKTSHPIRVWKAKL